MKWPNDNPFLLCSPLFTPRFRESLKRDRVMNIMAKKPPSLWTLYILKCADRTLYTGITNDLPARLEKHMKGTGAKYTRGRGPFEVVYTERHRTKSSALKRERAVKALRRAQKLALASN